MKANLEASKIDQLATVAMLKYKMDYSQARIAEILGVSSMTISRMLETAIDEGIVEISIKTTVDDDKELSRDLKERYKLHDALIVNSNRYEDTATTVAKTSAFYLDHAICPGDVLGVPAGRTLSQAMPYMNLPLIGRNKEQFRVVQLQGGYAALGDRNPTLSIINFANRFGIKGQLLQHPMYAPTIESAKHIHEHYAESLEKMWKKCTLLMCGVGVRGPGNLLYDEKLISDADLQELDEAEAVGDPFGRWFDADGRDIDCSCNRRLISVFPHIRQQIPRRILVASGDEKVQAIRVLLEKSMVNILVSDEGTAKKLLQVY